MPVITTPGDISQALTPPSEGIYCLSLGVWKTSRSIPFAYLRVPLLMAGTARLIDFMAAASLNQDNAFSLPPSDDGFFFMQQGWPW